ncbi:uncharacterized protein LOC110429747 [Sorghum bicolor]|uniref:uncharacterized protein LOC110429747 n=1 Tax=Sorghum bicolor TaxID=4558 RepID=UPI000B42431E|nr:uncharacterized protein LOC110429747 [Sorghum bicolor]|eukprot:XP_021301895.1 uncharacterized protein LOC110429747 [Sorghum bicolor]
MVLDIGDLGEQLAWHCTPAEKRKKTVWAFPLVLRLGPRDRSKSGPSNSPSAASSDGGAVPGSAAASAASAAPPPASRQSPRALASVLRAPAGDPAFGHSMSMVTCSWKCQWLLRKQSNHYCQEPLVYRLTSSVSEIFLQLAKGTRIPLLSHHQQR